MLSSHYHAGCRFQSLPRIRTMARSDGDPEESFRDASMRPRRSPAEQFAPLASTFRRRILVGIGSASLVALGADFGGITSLILGLSPETGRGLKLDVLYPIKGYSRCIETREGFGYSWKVQMKWIENQCIGRSPLVSLPRGGQHHREWESSLAFLRSPMWVHQILDRLHLNLSTRHISSGNTFTSEKLFNSEFIYPANWVGDQTLLYRAAGKAELERGLDPPPLNRRRQNLNEPVVAFGPPSTNGELNVSVIGSKVPLDFSIESFGGPEEVGEAIVQTIVGSSRRPGVKGNLVKSTLRNDPSKMVKYYELEFRVQSPSFRRHNIAVCCTQSGKLYTLNAQAPESAWPGLKADFYTIAESFVLTS